MKKYTDVFGISLDEFHAVSMEIWEVFRAIFKKGPNYNP